MGAYSRGGVIRGGGGLYGGAYRINVDIKKNLLKTSFILVEIPL